MTFGPPFSGKNVVSIVVPQSLEGFSQTDKTTHAQLKSIFEEFAFSLQLELGAPFRFVEDTPPEGPVFLLGPSTHNHLMQEWRGSELKGPRLFLDRTRQILVADGDDFGQVFECLSHFRSLPRHEGGYFPIHDAIDRAELVERVFTEVENTFPGFDNQGLDWKTLSESYKIDLLSADDPIPVLQAWLAELKDAHTWVRPAPAHGELPYRMFCDGKSAWFLNLSDDSKGAQLGVRPGWKLISENIEAWWKRTAAPEHLRPLFAGRRIFSAPLGTTKKLKAQSPDGSVIEWEEKVAPPSWDPAIDYQVMESGTAYLKIRVWLGGTEFHEKMQEAFDSIKTCSRLIVDLRGNPGGNLVSANHFRSRFLAQRTELGTLKFQVSRTESKETPIVSEPAPEDQRWLKPVRFLIDPLTYSASEDAILGLQQFPHIKVIGEPSGGGSGRVRTVRLIPGWVLTISTALTFDHLGRCIEGQGLAVDRYVAVDRMRFTDQTDHVLKAADSSW